MASYNKFIGLGNLTRTPELSYTKSGVPVCKFGLAINSQSGSRDNKREEVLFIDVTVWNKQAEFVAQYLKKGSSVLVDGRLKLDTWETEDGGKRSRHEVVAQVVQFMPKGEKSEGGKMDNPTRGNGEMSDDEKQEIPF